MSMKTLALTALNFILTTRIALKSSILPCYKTAYGVGIGTAKGYESTAVQLAWNECGDYSLSTRTNFALADMKAGAFAKLLTMLVGHSADQFDYGLAGNDHTATLAWLLELEQKIPVGHVSKMASSSCTEDKLSLGGDVWAVWGRTGRVLERKSHKTTTGLFVSETSKWSPDRHDYYIHGTSDELEKPEGETINPRKTGVCGFLERGRDPPLWIFNLEALNGPISYVVYSLGYI